MASDRLQKPVLVLNASYEPINICAARRALILVLKGVASAEETSTNAIHSARSQPASSMRCKAGYREPSSARRTSPDQSLMADMTA